MKEILFEKEARMKLLEGANKAYQIVSKTLGAKGRNVVIFENKKTYPYVTKDGINTITRINLPDVIENMGAQLIRQASAKTAEETGDATTTTAIIAYWLMDGGLRLLDSGISPVRIIQIMDKFMHQINELMQPMIIPVNDEYIRNVAYISSNNDPEMGEMIGNLMTSLGLMGKVVIQDSINGKTYYEEAPGMKINSGWISPYQVNVHHKGTMEYDKPMIMVTDEEVFRIDQVERFIGICLQNNRPGIIVAAEAGGEAIGTINHNIHNKGLKIGVITAPDHGGLSRDILQDIAQYCGATLVTERTGKTTKKVEIDMIGSCDKWVSDSNETTVINGAGDVSSRIKELENYIANGKDEKKVKDSEQRLANLTGKTAVIYVYGDTPSELVERKDRIDDAVNATKAAMKEGIVPGGGLTFWNIANEMDSENTPDDQAQIKEVITHAIRMPMLTILRNASINIKELEHLLTDTEGVNVITGTVVPLVDNGIIDPVMSLRVSLKNAYSVAKTVLTTDVVLS